MGSLAGHQPTMEAWRVPSGGRRFPDGLCCLFTPVSLGKTLPSGFSFLVEKWGDNPGLTFLGGHGGQSPEVPADG